MILLVEGEETVRVNIFLSGGCNQDKVGSVDSFGREAQDTDMMWEGSKV